MPGALQLEVVGARGPGPVEAAAGERRAHHAVGAADQRQDRHGHLLPREPGAKVDVAGDRAGADREVEQPVLPLVEVAPRLRVERDLLVVGYPAHRDRRSRRYSRQRPQQRRQAREGRVGVDLRVADAVADRGVDVGLTGEQIPARDPAERVT